MSNAELTGHVVGTSPRGFFFVMTAERREPYFIHSRQLPVGQFDFLKRGDLVAFKVGTDRQGRECGIEARCVGGLLDEAAPKGYLAAGQ